MQRLCHWLEVTQPIKLAMAGVLTFALAFNHHDTLASE